MPPSPFLTSSVFHQVLPTLRYGRPLPEGEGVYGTAVGQTRFSRYFEGLVLADSVEKLENH